MVTLGAVLEREGYRVTAAASAAQALRRLDDPTAPLFDLILADLRLDDPGDGDGMAVVSAARRRDPDAVAVVLTGYATVDAAIRALREGAYDFLVKPSDVDELKAVMARGLERRRLAQQARRADALEREIAARAGAEAALREAHDRLRRLQAVTAALAGALTPGQVADIVTHEGLAALGAPAAAIRLLAADGQTLDLLRATGYPDGIALPERVPPDAPLPVADAVRTGEPVWLESAAAAMERYPHRAAMLRSTGLVAHAALPLLYEGRPIGALAVSFATPQAFPDDQRTFLRTLAQLCANSLVRARLYDEILRDVSERKRADVAQRLLSEAGQLLGSSLDYERTLAGVARLVVPALAEWCTIYLREDGGLHRVGVAHDDPAGSDLLQRLAEQYPRRAAAAARPPDGPPPDGPPPDPVDRVVETGEALLVPAVDPDGLARHAQDPEHLRLLRRLDPRSSIVVPLVARGQVLGAIGLNRTGASPPYRPEDLALAQQLADRCAAAIDNARLYAEAQAAVRARDEFLAIAAHELRTPLTAVKGHAQGLLRALRRGTLAPDRLARGLEVLTAAGDRLAALTEELLDVGRLRTGHLALRLADVDLAAFAHEQAATFAFALDDTHRLVVDTPAEPCVVRADAARLEQVLANVLENAVKYSPDGGEIRVAVRCQDSGVASLVQDPGIGLPGGAAERIFAPFGRAANATGLNLPGMGLGLFISHGILERHGGWIRAESAGEGRGTTITFWLPVDATSDTGEVGLPGG